MLGRAVAGAVAALVLTGCGSVGETRGSSPPTTAAGTAQADADDQGKVRGCSSENWPGPWAACEEADWVRAVVRRAGYETGSDTGSALVASTDETSFYIWTTPGSAETVPKPGEHGSARSQGLPSMETGNRGRWTRTDCQRLRDGGSGAHRDSSSGRLRGRQRRTFRSASQPWSH
jgi:hypothetical protein